MLPVHFPLHYLSFHCTSFPWRLLQQNNIWCDIVLIYTIPLTDGYTTGNIEYTYSESDRAIEEDPCRIYCGPIHHLLLLEWGSYCHNSFKCQTLLSQLCSYPDWSNLLSYYWQTHYHSDCLVSRGGIYFHPAHQYDQQIISPFTWYSQVENNYDSFYQINNLAQISSDVSIYRDYIFKDKSLSGSHTVFHWCIFMSINLEAFQSGSSLIICTCVVYYGFFFSWSNCIFTCLANLPSEHSCPFRLILGCNCITLRWVLFFSTFRIHSNCLITPCVIHLIDDGLVWLVDMIISWAKYFILLWAFRCASNRTSLIISFWIRSDILKTIRTWSSSSTPSWCLLLPSACSWGCPCNTLAVRI